MDGAGTTHPTWDPAIGMLHQLFAAMETERRFARVFIDHRHQLAWPSGFTLAAHEVYHLILPIDERAVKRVAVAA